MIVKCLQSLVIQTWGDRGLGVKVRVSDLYHSSDSCRKPQWFMNATVCVSPLETDGLCDKVCDSHLQSARATESGHCSAWAEMASTAPLKSRQMHAHRLQASVIAQKCVRNSFNQRKRSLGLETKGFEDYPSGEVCECVWMTSDMTESNYFDRFVTLIQLMSLFPIHLKMYLFE